MDFFSCFFFCVFRSIQNQTCNYIQTMTIVFTDQFTVFFGLFSLCVHIDHIRNEETQTINWITETVRTVQWTIFRSVTNNYRVWWTQLKAREKYQQQHEPKKKKIWIEIARNSKNTVIKGYRECVCSIQFHNKHTNLNITITTTQEKSPMPILLSVRFV